jgi:hypothetical protein
MVTVRSPGPDSAPACALRRASLLGIAGWLGGCAGEVGRRGQPGDVAAGGSRPAAPVRRVSGGFLARVDTAFGNPARSGSGAYVRLLAPSAVAVAGHELLVVDAGAGRLWRVDADLQTISEVVGAPASPATAVALGPDLSAWVHDGQSRQVLRFAREGRLLQTLRIDLPPSVLGTLALADGGATLLLPDSVQRAWLEWRAVGAWPTVVRPMADGQPALRSLDALAVGGNTVYLLDRLAGLVLVAQRDGRVRARLGEGVLRQPASIAADRHGRVFVVDAQDRRVLLLREGQAALALDAARLQVQSIGGIAVDERMLAVSDRIGGQVVLHLLQALEAA